MKLIIAIIQDEQVNKVVRTLMESKIRTTKLASSGGFLKSGNTTLLIGTEEKDIEKIVAIIDRQSKSTKVKDEGKEVTVGAANLFVIDVDSHVKL